MSPFLCSPLAPVIWGAYFLWQGYQGFKTIYSGYQDIQQENYLAGFTKIGLGVFEVGTSLFAAGKVFAPVKTAIMKRLGSALGLDDVLPSAPPKSPTNTRARVPWKFGDTADDALGETDPFGNITIRRGLSGKELDETVRHESVHRFFSPKYGPFRDWRAYKGFDAYENSHLVRYLEEAIAEGYATRSVLNGLRFPIGGDNPYVSGVRVIAEGLGYLTILAGASYGAYYAGSGE